MLHINDMTHYVGGRRLFDRATLAIPAGGRVALVGRNGTGKTTLLRLIAGEAQPDSGTVAVRAGGALGPYETALVGRPVTVFVEEERVAHLQVVGAQRAGGVVEPEALLHLVVAKVRIPAVAGGARSERERARSAATVRIVVVGRAVAVVVQTVARVAVVVPVGAAGGVQPVAYVEVVFTEVRVGAVAR